MLPVTLVGEVSVLGPTLCAFRIILILERSVATFEPRHGEHRE